MLLIHKECIYYVVICKWKRNKRKSSVGTVASEFWVTIYIIIGCGLCIKTILNSHTLLVSVAQIKIFQFYLIICYYAQSSSLYEKSFTMNNWNNVVYELLYVRACCLINSLIIYFIVVQYLFAYTNYGYCKSDEHIKIGKRARECNSIQNNKIIVNKIWFPA